MHLLLNFSKYYRDLSFIRNSAWHIAPELAQTGLVLISGIITAKLLLPNELGSIKFICLIFTYSTLLGLGTLDGLNLTIPKLIGTNQADQAQVYTDTCLTFSILNILVATVPFLFIILFFFAPSPATWFGCLSIIVQALLYQLFNILSCHRRAFFDFQSVAIAKMLYAITYAILNICLCWLFDIYGVFSALMLAYVPPILFLVVIKGQRFTLTLSIPQLKTLLGLGLPMVGSNFIITLFDSVDKWFVKFGLMPDADPDAALGYYTIAFSLAGMLVILPIRAVSVFAQYLRLLWSRSPDLPFAWRQTQRFALLILTCFIPILLLGSEIFNALILFFLNNYHPALKLIPIFLIVAVVQSIFHVFNAFLVVTDHRIEILICQSSALLVSVLLYFLAIDTRIVDDIDGIALTLLASNLILVLMLCAATACRRCSLFTADIGYTMIIVALFPCAIMAQSTLLPYLKNHPETWLTTITLRLGTNILFIVPFLWTTFRMFRFKELKPLMSAH